MIARVFAYGTLVGLLVLLVVLVPRALGDGGWRFATASAYSTADSPGPQSCSGRPLRDDTLTFASYLVPCGGRVRFCLARRCVTATRTDSGPSVSGRSFDLALGTVRALGFRSATHFGVRAIRWRRAA